VKDLDSGLKMLELWFYLFVNREKVEALEKFGGQSKHSNFFVYCEFILECVRKDSKQDLCLKQIPRFYCIPDQPLKLCPQSIFSQPFCNTIMFQALHQYYLQYPFLPFLLPIPNPLKPKAIPPHFSKVIVQKLPPNIFSLLFFLFADLYHCAISFSR
jgi:hypothetical protein